MCAKEAKHEKYVTQSEFPHKIVWLIFICPFWESPKTTLFGLYLRHSIHRPWKLPSESRSENCPKLSQSCLKTVQVVRKLSDESFQGGKLNQNSVTVSLKGTKNRHSILLSERLLLVPLTTVKTSNQRDTSFIQCTLSTVWTAVATGQGLVSPSPTKRKGGGHPLGLAAALRAGGPPGGSSPWGRRQTHGRWPPGGGGGWIGGVGPRVWCVWVVWWSGWGAQDGRDLVFI